MLLPSSRRPAFTFRRSMLVHLVIGNLLRLTSGQKVPVNIEPLLQRGSSTLLEALNAFNLINPYYFDIFEHPIQIEYI